MFFLVLVLACGAPQEPSSPAEGSAQHDAPDAADQEVPPVADPVVEREPIEGALGEYTAQLTPAVDSLTLRLSDAKGVPVPASGVVKVVLTGTGQSAQRVMLEAEGDGWSGAAKATDAVGYTAVVSVVVDGVKQVGKLSWGEVPEVAAPAPHGHDHAHGNEQHHPHGGHGHDHGDHGHDHGDHGH